VRGEAKQNQINIATSFVQGIKSQIHHHFQREHHHPIIHFPSKSQLRFRLQLIQDRLLKTLGLSRAGPSPLNLPITTNQELLKVPLHRLQPKQSGLLFLQPLENRGCIAAIDLDLSENGKSNTIVDLAEALDIIV